MIFEWFREKKQLIASIVVLVTIIWGIILLLLTFGAFAPKTLDGALAYFKFLSKMIMMIIPIIISCLALVPLYHNDDTIVPVISYGIVIIDLIIILFTDSITNKLFLNLIYCDLLVLITYLVNTSSDIHRVYKIILCLLGAVYIFMTNPIGKDSASTNLLSSDYSDILSSSLTSDESETYAKVKFSLAMMTFVGFLLNPGIAVITDDGTSMLGGGKGSSYDRSETPLEMYNRLISQKGGAPTPEAPEAPGVPPIPVPGAPVPPVPGSPVPPPAPTQPVGPVGPVPPAMQTTAPSPVAPAPSEPAKEAPVAEEKFEVPESMAFLLDNNDNQDNSNN